jgi:hypothetical protein
MASIIDSFRDVFVDKFSFFKILALACPLYYSYQVYMQSKSGFFWFSCVAGVTLFFMLGFFIRIINNMLNDCNSVLPSLNPFILGFVALKGVLAILPVTWISVWLANYVCSMIYIVPWLDTTLKVYIWLVVVSVVLTTLLMFCTKEKIQDSYNMKLLSKASGDMILSLVFFVIQLVILNLPTTGFLGYTLLILFGQGSFFNFFVALAVVFNVAVAAHYMAQVHYELLGG